MKIESGQTVVLTGASGGLGTYLSKAFGDRGIKLALVAYPGAELEQLRKDISKGGIKALALPSDLRDPAQRRAVVALVTKELGEIDILINNAGVEFTAPYHELSEENICDVLRVNLEASMIMARLVLPTMLRRKRGHIVNISSLAGRCGPAFQEPYAASKAGLIAFTSSFRSTYRREGVSASVITPGFVETGIYTKLKSTSGCSAPALFGTSAPEKVVRSVFRAIERDIPEIIINPVPVRPLLILNTLFPTVGEWVTEKLGANKFFGRVVEAHKKAATSQPNRTESVVK
jgi:short-subunit dehydrogenase